MTFVWFQLPLLLIGATMAAYWYRVLRMARKQRRQTGRAANLVPAETLGRVLRLVWTPVIILWIALPLLAGAGVSAGKMLSPVLEISLARWPAALLVVAWYLATRACWKRMGRHWRMGIDPSEQNTLIVEGPFAYVRHPIYCLSASMMVLTAIALPSPAMLATAALHLLLLAWESAREERHLSRLHGEAYAKYQRAVGRLFPRRWRPYQPG